MLLCTFCPMAQQNVQQTQERRSKSGVPLVCQSVNHAHVSAVAVAVAVVAVAVAGAAAAAVAVVLNFLVLVVVVVVHLYALFGSSSSPLRCLVSATWLDGM